MDQQKFYQLDPWLEPHYGTIAYRHQQYTQQLADITRNYGSLQSFASAHRYFGLHAYYNGWVFREYAPHANEMFLVGTFNNWQPGEDWRLQKNAGGAWEGCFDADAIKHGDLYKMLVRWQGGEGYRIPAYCNRVVQDSDTYLFNAEVYHPRIPYTQMHEHVALGNKAPFVYECHIGMSSEEGKVSTFNEFRENVLPRIAALGYNTIQIMAIQEHPYYGSFGYHVSNFFAVSSRFGTPDELKRLIDAAHGRGIAVIMDLVHSHAVRNELEGLATIDGSGKLYFYNDYRRLHPAWDSLCFDYAKEETQQFLLSNCRYWIEEYGFDGYRFDGITSMIFTHHGLGKNIGSYNDYYNNEQDENALIYLTLANKLIHEIHPQAITIAEEVSGMPGLAAKVENEGIGFDYRMAMGIPDYWIKIIKEQPDEAWSVNSIFHEMTNHRAEEKTINYAESHDQALVGDKTIIFRLADKEMYEHMLSADHTMEIDRAIALHKMIRLITSSTICGGYLNFMGNEFGHPEWIDFPREGNNWSYHYARRQWSLVDNNDLKFRQLNAFDQGMVKLLASDKDLMNHSPELIVANEGDQVLIFKRGDMVFAFNFSPANSYTDYGFLTEPGKFRIVLNSDAEAFGGFNRIEDKMLYYTMNPGGISTQHWLKIYLPSRTALVFQRVPIKKVF